MSPTTGLTAFELTEGLRADGAVLLGVWRESTAAGADGNDRAAGDVPLWRADLPPDHSAALARLAGSDAKVGVSLQRLGAASSRLDAALERDGGAGAFAFAPGEPWERGGPEAQLDAWLLAAGAGGAGLAFATDQGPSGPSERGAQGPSGPSERGAQGPSGPSERGAQGPSGPSEREGQGPSGTSERASQGPSGPSERASQGPSGPSERASQDPAWWGSASRSVVRFSGRVARWCTPWSRVETLRGGRPTGLSLIGIGGDVHTVLGRGIRADDAAVHQRVVALAVTSRATLFRVLGIVGRGATSIGSRLALPGGPLLALPAVWRFVNEVITEAAPPARG